jgi:hypothetical protein
MMETERDFYIAWLEVQLENDKLEREWRDMRRGKKDGNKSRSGYGQEENGVLRGQRGGVLPPANAED